MRGVGIVGSGRRGRKGQRARFTTVHVVPERTDDSPRRGPGYADVENRLEGRVCIVWVAGFGINVAGALGG